MADKKISELTGATTPLAGTEVLPIVQGGNTVKVSVDNLTTGKAVSTGNLTVTGTLTGSTGVMNIGSGQLYKDAQGNVSVGTATPEGILTVKGGASPNARQVIVGYGSTSQNYYDANTHTWRTGFFGTAMELNSTSLTLTSRDLVIGTSGKGIDFSAAGNAAGMTSELLADYEEGTFSPTIYGSTTAGSHTYLRQFGAYRKVGNLVHVQLFVSLSAKDANMAGNIYVGGLPFTTKNFGSDIRGGAAIGSWSLATQAYAILGYYEENSTGIRLNKVNTLTVTPVDLVPADISDSTSIILSATYST